MRGLDTLVVRELVKWYLLEDLGHGDITTCHLPSRDDRFTAVITAKEKGILAGVPLVKELFLVLDPESKIQPLVEEGAPIEPGLELALVSGAALALLRGERTALNILQRLSGVATATREMVKLISSTKARLVDTRKTTPGFRLAEKYAVTVGGGMNHRMGLYDCVMIKENHLTVAGSIRAAVEAIRSGVPFTARLEVEVRNLQELEDALAVGVDLVLLDNMDVPTLKKAVTMAKGKAFTEASGGITPDNILGVAETGVDYISSGGIIHHAMWLDINMKIR
jgi:nicotinate-nucleotide pyrophosphorylase (carboxylating)